MENSASHGCATHVYRECRVSDARARRYIAKPNGFHGRSSTRALPRVSVGRCGLIFENCAFVNQNWSRLIYASFSEAVNHATTFVPTLLWVRTLGPRPSGQRAP